VATSVATRLGVHLALVGLLAAGTPDGTPAFQAANAEACASHACRLMDEMQALPLADQDRWILLHGSLQRRVAHLPQGCEWQHVGLAVRWAEDRAVDSVFAILEVPRVDSPLTEQITLPLRHGGLPHHPRPRPSGISGRRRHRFMLKGNEAFQPFDGPSIIKVRPQWEALHDVVRGGQRIAWSTLVLLRAAPITLR
jgi:hypothetical protein